MKIIFLLCSLLSIGNLYAEKPIRVLSLDGGGIRGIIEIRVLSKIEEELQKPISDIFDVVAGTSTGGLIALSLNTPGENNSPKYKAQDLLSLYLLRSKEIFSASLAHKISTGFGMWGPKYNSIGVIKNTNRIFTDSLLSQSLTNTLITGYYVDGESGVEFSSHEAKTFPLDKDCLMKEVAMATAAAPVYFASATVNYSWGSLQNVVDGGLYRNNPALVAYLHAKKLWPDRKIEVYSIGAGKLSANEIKWQIKGRGLLQWISPIIHHLQVADMEAENDILHKLLNENGEQNFFRLNGEIDKNHRKMDDTTASNLSYLMSKGDDYIATPIFHNMLSRLKAYP